MPVETGTGNVDEEIKMAAKSLACELMSLLSPFNYQKQAQYLTPRDCLTPEDFIKMPLSKYYAVDIDKTLCRGKPNPQILYDIFGEFSQEESADVKLHTLDLISQEIDLYEKIGTTYLLHLGISMEGWLNMMLRKTSFADELMLYALSRSYNRHTIVYNKNRLWCTMDINQPLSPTEIHNHCDVHLVYITGGLFAQLRLKPDTLLLPMVLNSSTLDEPMDMSITGPPTQDLIIKPKDPSTQKTVLENVHVEITVNSSGTIEDIVTNLDPDVTSSEIKESRVLVNPPINIDFSSIVVPTAPNDVTSTSSSDPIGVNASTQVHTTTGPVSVLDPICANDINPDISEADINQGNPITIGVNGIPSDTVQLSFVLV